MRLPRDLSGDDLVKRLAVFGYVPTSTSLASTRVEDKTAAEQGPPFAPRMTTPSLKTRQSDLGF